MGICQVNFLSTYESLKLDSRTTEWTSRHGTITFDRQLFDMADGAYEVRLFSLLMPELDPFCLTRET